jgi:hypothetical protein
MPKLPRVSGAEVVRAAAPGLRDRAPARQPHRDASRLRGLRRAEPPRTEDRDARRRAQAGPRQHARYCGTAYRQLLGNGRHRVAALSEGDDAPSGPSGNRSRGSVRRGGSVHHPGFAIDPIALHPAPKCALRNARGGRGRLRRFAPQDSIDHHHSTPRGQSGILMHVHSVPSCWLAAEFAPNSFQQRFRMDNVLKLHT